MHNTIHTHRSLPNFSNTSIEEATSKNASPSASEGNNDSASTSNPVTISTEVPKKTTSPSTLQVEYRKQNAASEGESSTRRFGRQSSFLQPLLRRFSSNRDRDVEGNTTIVRSDDARFSPPAPPATPSPSSWLMRSSLLRKTGIVLGESLNHFTVAAIVWGTISPLINQANGVNSVEGGDYKRNYRIAALNTLAMIPISFVLTNTLFGILRGIMGYDIKKTELEEAFSDPGMAARLKTAQKDTDYNGAIADVIYSCIFGAGMVGGATLPISRWVKEAGLSLSENNQQIVNSAMQIAIAAAALALVRTSMKLSRSVEGVPTYQIQSLGHHNPIENLKEQFKAITQTKRRDEPSNISSNYRAVRNLALRMLEEGSVWGGSTLYSLPTGIGTAVVRSGANTPMTQFLSGYMTVTLGYFFDAGNSLHNTRIDEDFSPWKFLGLWDATKSFFMPDLPPPSSTMRALDESAGIAKVAQSMAKDIENIAERILHAKNVATVYGPRIALETATSAEHTLLALLARNQQSSVKIEEVGSDMGSVELVQTQNPSIPPSASAPLQTGSEEAISHIIEVAPPDTHDNPASQTSEVAQTQNSLTPLQTGNEEVISHIVEVAPLLAHYRQRSTDQQPSIPIEEINSSASALTQNSSTSLQTSNEEVISHIVDIAPPKIEKIDSSELAQTQNLSTPLQTGNEEAISHIVEVVLDDINDKGEHGDENVGGMLRHRVPLHSEDEHETERMTRVI